MRMSRVLPILFNTEMVQAILDGKKLVTRRAVKYKYSNTEIKMRTDKYGTRLIEIQRDIEGETYGRNQDGTSWHKLRPYIEKYAPYQPGDILYVRETWFYEQHMENLEQEEPDLPSGRYSRRYIYRADNPEYPVDMGVGGNGWEPSIHMPKEAARIWLRVTDVRVERLQDITEEQAEAEGLKDDVEYCKGKTARAHFIDLWNSTIKKSEISRYGWDANPWVWVIEFERCGKPESEV